MWEMCFFKNHAENDSERLVQDLFFFFFEKKRALYEAKASG